MTYYTSMIKKSLKVFKISLLMFLIYLQVTSVDLHRHFHVLGAGIIEDVRVQRDKGFGFVRYSTHAEASLAIQMGNARILCGKPLKVHSLLDYYIFGYKTGILYILDFGYGLGGVLIEVTIKYCCLQYFSDIL